MKRRNFVTAFSMGLAGWIGKAALPAEAQAAGAATGIVPEGSHLLGKSVPSSAIQREAARQRETWIRKAAAEIGTIRPGMTRADLLRICKPEGGLSTQTQGQYVYRDCSLIMVEVFFQPVSALLHKGPAHEDIITQISRPFIVAFNILD
ncbi:MAG: hypothetical protein V4671_16925 [Armatimonadota bacterium]